MRSILPVSQRLFDALQILAQSTENKFAISAARHFAAKQFEDYTKKLKDIDDIATPHQP